MINRSDQFFINVSFLWRGWADLVLNNNGNNNKKKETRTSGSVLTFSNPNYNVAEGDIPAEPKGKVWNRMKYDKAKVKIHLINHMISLHFVLE